MVAIVLAVYRHRAAGRRVEAEAQSHRRRLPRSVRAEGHRGDAGLHGECEIVDGGLLAVPFAEMLCVDHWFLLLCREPDAALESNEADATLAFRLLHRPSCSTALLPAVE